MSLSCAKGIPHKEILEVAEQLHCDLIILTTTGRDHLLEHVKGSGAERIVARSHVPILVLPVVTLTIVSGCALKSQPLLPRSFRGI